MWTPNETSDRDRKSDLSEIDDSAAANVRAYYDGGDITDEEGNSTTSCSDVTDIVPIICIFPPSSTGKYKA